MRRAAGFDGADVQLTLTMSPAWYFDLIPATVGPDSGSTAKKVKKVNYKKLYKFVTKFSCIY